MDINKIAWLTDIHLNFVDSETRKKFYKNIDQTECEAILITGDIAEAPSVCDILKEFSEHTNKKIYFVLGNHDYYSGTVAIVRERIITLCSKIVN
jgi:predicted MPP superfamily phosphohydrolase